MSKCHGSIAKERKIKEKAILSLWLNWWLRFRQGLIIQGIFIRISRHHIIRPHNPTKPTLPIKASLPQLLLPRHLLIRLISKVLHRLIRLIKRLSIIKRPPKLLSSTRWFTSLLKSIQLPAELGKLSARLRGLSARLGGLFVWPGKLLELAGD